MERKRIGVIIRSFREKELVALKYLILEQNVHQQSFEFEVLPVPEEDPFVHLLDAKESLDREMLEREVEGFVHRYRAWLQSDAEEYDLACDPPQHIVLVSAFTFSDQYYSTGSKGWTIVALGDWNKTMAPPSIGEFILTQLADVAVELACGDFQPSHHGTKGCVSDFTADLSEARFMALSGYLCPMCESVLKQQGTPTLLKDVQTLLRRNWLGSVADPTAPSAIAKKLGYDLFQTKGFKPTWTEKAVEVLEEEWAKEAIKVVGVIVGTALVFWLGLRSA